MKIFVLGANGMLGTYVDKYFRQQDYDVFSVTRLELDASRSSEIGLMNFGFEPEDVIINCVGLIKHREGLAILDFIRVNTVFPLELSNVCEEIGCKLIHITTDCVFSGKDGNYDEDSDHDAKDIYGISKSLGEPENATIIRTSIIGEEEDNQLSLVEWIKKQTGKETNGYTNHFWNGITCLQFAKICEYIIEEDVFWQGVKHIVSPTAVNKQELVQMVSDVYDLDITVNPFETPEKCDRTMSSIRTDVEIEMPELEDQIRDMKEFYNGFK